MEGEVAIILVRSPISARPEVKATLKKLSLARKNGCVIVKNSENLKGMLQNIKDYTTWGIINPDTKKKIESRIEKDKKIIRLSPPKKGYGNKGIKVPFTMNGALGNRKEKINELIERMI